MCSKCIVSSQLTLSSILSIAIDANDAQAEGRKPPTYKSTSIVQDLDLMEEYVEEYVQDVDHEWILPDHD